MREANMRLNWRASTLKSDVRLTLKAYRAHESISGAGTNAAALACAKHEERPIRKKLYTLMAIAIALFCSFWPSSDAQSGQLPSSAQFTAPNELVGCDGTDCEIFLTKLDGDCSSCLWLQFRGELTTGAARAIKLALERYGFVEVLQLHSPGGSPYEAMELGRWLRENRIATVVGDTNEIITNGRRTGGKPSPGLCSSACVYLFAAGERRVVFDGSQIGVHQFYSDTDLDLSSGELLSLAQSFQAEISTYLVDMGIDTYLQTLAGAHQHDQLRILSNTELRETRLASDVLVNPSDFYQIDRSVNNAQTDPFGDQPYLDFPPPDSQAECGVPKFELVETAIPDFADPNYMAEMLRRGSFRGSPRERNKTIRAKNRLWRTTCVAYFDGPLTLDRWNIVASALRELPDLQTPYAVDRTAGLVVAKLEMLNPSPEINEIQRRLDQLTRELQE